MYGTLFGKTKSGIVRILRPGTRSYSSKCNSGRGLVLGVYDGCEPGDVFLTSTGQKFDDCMEGKITEFLKNKTVYKRDGIVIGSPSPEYDLLAIVGVGVEGLGFNKVEQLEECKENIRIASGIGARMLQDKGIGMINVEAFTNAEAAAEGSHLGVFAYSELRSDEEEDKIVTPKLLLFDSDDTDKWKQGQIKASAQNLARYIEQTPANLMTPSIFAQLAIEKLCPCGVEVEARSREWIESHRLNAFLQMAKGSCELPILLELRYCGNTKDIKPVTFVGKGVTFDTGGLNIKDGSEKCPELARYRADLAGAATIVGIFKAAAQMNLPINLVGLLPLCENMPGGMAVKPGDVVITHDEKNVVIENTDNEGRVILADVLAFSKRYNPCLVISLGDMKTSMKKGIGEPCSAVYATSNQVWKELNRAGAETGDRFWRFPLWKEFKSRVTNYVEVDVNNVGKGKGGDPCLAAAFLTEFAPPGVDFVHIDISGTGLEVDTDLIPYLKKGYMSGRPTRPLVQFLYQLACPHTICNDC